MEIKFSDFLDRSNRLVNHLLDNRRRESKVETPLKRESHEFIKHEYQKIPNISPPNIIPLNIIPPIC